MVVTTLEAQVDPERGADLVREFDDGTKQLPPAIRESFLLRAAKSDVWRIVTVWRDKEALEAYRASVETPEGVLMFRAAGAEPTLTVFEVAAHAAQ